MQLRQLFIAMAIGTTIACVASFASAQQVYKWKDANGVVHYSQTAPTSGTNYSTVKLTGEPDISSNPAATSSAKPAATPPVPANRLPANNGTQANTPANLKRLCSQIDSNITALQGKTPVVRQDGEGGQSVMSDDQREQQLATAQAQKRKYCSPKATSGNGG